MRLMLVALLAALSTASAGVNAQDTLGTAALRCADFAALSPAGSAANEDQERLLAVALTDKTPPKFGSAWARLLSTRSEDFFLGARFAVLVPVVLEELQAKAGPGATEAAMSAIAENEYTVHNCKLLGR